MEYFQKKGRTESQQKEFHTPEGEIKIYCHVCLKIIIIGRNKRSQGILYDR